MVIEKIEKVEKMTLKCYYNSLKTDDEKKAFRDRLIEETKKSYPTVYAWLREHCIPSFLEQKLITDISNGVIVWE